MNRLTWNVFVIVLTLVISCRNEKFPAYENIQQMSAGGGFYGDSGPYSLQSQNGEYHLLSIPYNHVNVIMGDLCSGTTKIYLASDSKPLYTIDRYFGPDNTFFSNDGSGIAYVNNYWRGSDYDSCSSNILEYYRNGRLEKSYSYFDLIGVQPNDNEHHWLYYNVEANDWLTKNNHYQIEDKLYLVPQRTGQVFVFDMVQGEIIQQVDTSQFLKNLDFRIFPTDRIKFITPYEFEGLPDLRYGDTFRMALAQALNVDLVDPSEYERNEIYYFQLSIKAFIDTSGYCLESKISSNELILMEEVNDIFRKTKSFLADSHFAIDSLPYNLDYWPFKDWFYIARRPHSLARADKVRYRKGICQRDSSDGIYIPRDLMDALTELDKILDDSSKALIKSGEDGHFGLGLYLRNNWGLWGGGRLKCYFDDRGLTHPDYISGLIIGTYQKKLLGEAFDKDSLIAYYAKMEKEWFSQ